jgi:hypothetical protein
MRAGLQSAAASDPGAKAGPTESAAAVGKKREMSGTRRKTSAKPARNHREISAKIPKKEREIYRPTKNIANKINRLREIKSMV